MKKWLQQIRFDDSGLIPAVVQDFRSGDVLMMAYMNRLSLEKTLQTGLTHFWSRSRKRLWKKGEESGHFQKVHAVHLDCDQDTLLVQVEQTRVACHTGRWSCFHHKMGRGRWVLVEEGPSSSQDEAILDQIYQVILDRRKHPRKDSYVSTLLKGGRDRILRKVGEESSELIVGSMNNRKTEIISEMADLWFHTLVLLGHHRIKPQDVTRELKRRFGKSGLREKEKTSRPPSARGNKAKRKAP